MNVPRDGGGGVSRVSGDHHHAHARVLALHHRVRNLRPGGVLQHDRSGGGDGVARIGDTLTPLELHPSFFGKLLEIRVVIFGAGKCPLRENYLKLE